MARFLLFFLSDFIRNFFSKGTQTLWAFLFLLTFSWSGWGQTVTIGSGTSSGYVIPVNSYFGYTYSQQIVLQSEIATSGSILKIKFYMVGGVSLSNSNNWTIYMGHTTKTTFASDTDWVPYASLTQVYTGTIAATPSEGWYEITLTTPFAYNNTDNLVVAVDENTSGFNGSTSYVRTWTTPVANRAIHYRNDSTNPDPSSPPTASGRIAYINQMQLELGTPSSCSAPNLTAATGITTTSANINWNAANPAPIGGYQWEVRTSGAGGSGATGLIASGSVGAGVLTAAVSGLTQATTYSVYVSSDCGSSTYSSWSSAVSFTTLCNSINTFPWTENFNTVTTPALPSCWSYNNANADSDYFQTYSTYGVSSSITAGLNTDFNSGANNDYLILPKFNLTGNQRLKFYVSARSTSEPNDYRVVLSTSGNASSDFTTQLMPLTTVSSTTMTEISPIDLSSYSGEVFIAIHVPSGGLDGYYIYFDNFTVEDIPACPAPTALTATGITTSSATLGWTSSNTTFNVEYGVTGFTQGAGTIANGASNPHTISSLTANTNYQYYVQSDCGASGTSTWAGPFSFYTGYCTPASTLSSTYINNFSTTGGSTNISNLASGYTTGGYQDNYSTQVVTDYQNGSFNFAMDIEGGTVGVAIWVDFNNNLTFETTEKVFNTTAYNNGPFSGTITIPNTVTPGDYRMRVMVDYNSANPTNPCNTTSTRTETEDYKLTVLLQPTDTPDWANIQWITDGTNGSNTSLTVNAWTTVTGYAQVYENGLTNGAGQGAGIECWITGNSQNTDPSTWPNDSWEVATFQGDSGNNDEYKLVKVMDFTGTVYVAARWRLNGGPFVYGGYNAPWNGTTSNSIQLIVNPVVVNDNCAGAISLTVNPDSNCTSITNGTTVNATESQADNNDPCAGINDDDVWYSFVATATSHIISLSNVVAVTGTSTDMYFQVLNGTCGSLTSLLCSDNNSTTISNLTVGSTYLVRVYSNGSTSRQTFDICVGIPPSPPTNDTCAGAIALTPAINFASGFVTGTILAATTTAGITPSCQSSSYFDVWYSVVIPASGSITIESQASDSNSMTDSVIAAYTGTCGSLVAVGCNDDDGVGIMSLLSLTGQTPGNTLVVGIWKYGSTIPTTTNSQFKIAAYDASLSLEDNVIDGFSMYPNPANEILYFKANNTIDAISIYNMFGQEVLKVNASQTDVQVNLTELNAGAYIVKVQSGNQIGAYNLIKQ